MAGESGLRRCTRRTTLIDLGGNALRRGSYRPRCQPEAGSVRPVGSTSASRNGRLRGEPRSEQDMMAKMEAADGTSERKRISIPKVDTSVLDWWERQHDAGMSIRLLIRREIERSGYTDIVHGRVEQRLRNDEV